MENKVVETNKTNEDSFVKLINVNKIYDKNVHAVFDFNIDIKKKEFIVFVGPSGCGKSTTLRMIAGLEDISSGELYINGVLCNNLPSKDRDIAMVFQNYALYPNMNVYENMAFSLKVRHYPSKEIRQRVEEAAEALELTDYLARKPKALSGGQRQRVALGRAFVRNAQLFLMDEPLSNLDAKLRVQTRSEIIRLHKKLNTTTIYVTHDQTEAMTMADRIVVMKGGYVQQIGTPLEIYRYPANKFVASFIGSPAMNFANATLKKGTLYFKDGSKIVLAKDILSKIDAFYTDKLNNVPNQLNELVAYLEEENNKIKNSTGLFKTKKLIDIENHKDVFALKAEYEAAKGYAETKEINITFGIRPEDIKLVDSKTKDCFETEVKLSELLGDQYYVHFDFAGKNMLAKIETEDTIVAGDKIVLKMRLNKMHLFDKSTGVAIDLRK